MRLTEILEGLPVPTLERLMAARGAALDPRKVLSAPEQAARALAPLPRDLLAGLPGSARTALERLAVAPRGLPRAELGGGVLPLVEAGLAFAVGDAIVVPTAVRVQLPLAPGEDPRSARALLSRLGDDAIRLLLHGVLRERAGGPRPLALGELLALLEEPVLLRRTIDALPNNSRNALSAIEARGGEVPHDTLLELAREPARYGPATGLPTRGTAQALLAAGLVLPAGGDRFVLPTEVAAVAGRERRALLASRYAQVLARIERAEEPARARLAVDPGPLALALAIELAAREPSTERVVPRTTLASVATALDTSPEHVELLVPLVRALSLRPLALRDVGPAMVALYRSTALGDETRPHPQRAARRGTANGIVAIRELALDTLMQLPRGRFVPVSEAVLAARSDLRADGLEATLAQIARATPGEVEPSLAAALTAILSRSFPALGLVDVAPDGSLRLSARAGRLLETATPNASPTPPRWDGGRARFGADASAWLAMSLAPIARPALDEDLVIVLDASRAAPLSLDRDAMASALARCACPRALVESTLSALPAAVATLHATDVVRWIPIPDASLRERLLADPKIAREVVENGPEGGLLIHAHGSFPRLARLFARHGLDLRKPA
jgi:hypothetical protein